MYGSYTLRKYVVSLSNMQTVISHSFHIRVLMFEINVIMLLMFRLDCILLNRRMRFISAWIKLCSVNNSSLQFLFNVTSKQELITVIGLMGLGRSKIGLYLKNYGVLYVNIVLIVDKCALFCSTCSANY